MNKAPTTPAQQQEAENARQIKISEAIGRLVNNADFKVFVDEVLVEEWLKQRDSNDELLQYDAILRGQGEARTYGKILKAVDGAFVNWVRLRGMEAERVRGIG